MSINQSLAHGLNILLIFDTAHPSFTVAEISKRLKYSQSKTYRMIRTLVGYSLLQEIPGTARYSLGLNALRIGLLAQQSLTLSPVARPFMKELVGLAGETVLLTVVNGSRAVCLERVESEGAIRYTVFQPGASIPLHAGASSKILMAYLPEEEWDRIIAKEGLRRYTPSTITQKSRLKSHLREIRRRGYAFSDQEVDQDVRAIAAPILNATGQMVAGLSIAGPAFRINKKKVGFLKKVVTEYAERISTQLGYSLT
jgi:IclR family KDG regulon transcriptional repressor